MTNTVLRRMVADGAVSTGSRAAPCVPAVRGTLLSFPRLAFRPAVGESDLGPQPLLFALLASFMAPPLLSFLAEERTAGLFFMMRTQGMRLDAYWLGVYLFCMTVLLAFSAILLAFGYVFSFVTFVNTSAPLNVLLFVAFAHINTGAIALAGAVLGRSRLVSVLAVRACGRAWFRRQAASH